MLNKQLDNHELLEILNNNHSSQTKIDTLLDLSKSNVDISYLIDKNYTDEEWNFLLKYKDEALSNADFIYELTKHFNKSYNSSVLFDIARLIKYGDKNMIHKLSSMTLTEDEIYFLRYIAMCKIDIDYNQYLQKGFYREQFYYIADGYSRGYDISEYAKPEYNHVLMHYIHKGFWFDKSFNIKNYINVNEVNQSLMSDPNSPYFNLDLIHYYGQYINFDFSKYYPLIYKNSIYDIVKLKNKNIDIDTFINKSHDRLLNTIIVNYLTYSTSTFIDAYHTMMYLLKNCVSSGPNNVIYLDGDKHLYDALLDGKYWDYFIKQIVENKVHTGNATLNKNIYSYLEKLYNQYKHESTTHDKIDAESKS